MSCGTPPIDTIYEEEMFLEYTVKLLSGKPLKLNFSSYRPLSDERSLDILLKRPLSISIYHVFSTSRYHH